MSGFSVFMKGNKKAKENVKYVATTSIVDENGNSPEWEFKQISSKENDRIKNDNIIDIPVKGKKGVYRPRVDTFGYIADLIVASAVVPNLYDEELQNSYGVKNPKDLLYAMVDNSGEYNDLSTFVQELNGFDTDINDSVEEAKN
ncbi:MAG: hypothetical protein LUD81_10055 [Clostridiales bacterium]|nr:hypothetical protein [Clostridiales bacterium]